MSFCLVGVVDESSRWDPKKLDFPDIFDEGLDIFSNVYIYQLSNIYQNQIYSLHRHVVLEILFCFNNDEP